MASVQCDVYVLVDAAGDYSIGLDEEQARQAYENDVQALADCDGFRLVKLTVSVPRPEIVALAGAVPEQRQPGPLVAVVA